MEAAEMIPAETAERPPTFDRAFGMILRRQPQGPYLQAVTSSGSVIWTGIKQLAMRCTPAGAEKLGQDLWQDDRIKVKAHLFHTGVLTARR